MRHIIKRATVLLALLLVTGLLVQPPFGQPVQAQQGLVWTAQYFNNQSLQSPVAAYTTVDSVYFNWGTGSPADGVNADEFSARYNTSGYFSEGWYRFYMRADDGVQLIVDDVNTIISTYNAPRVGELLSADLYLTAGNHKLQVDYREITGAAYVYLTWANLNTTPGGPVLPPEPAPPQSPPPPQPNGNWVAEYYNNANLQGFPVITTNVTSPTANWGYGSPNQAVPVDYFSVRWTSTQYLDAGTYRFSVRADDGVRLYIDGINYINEWRPSPGNTYTTNVTLSTGNHTIILEYYEGEEVAYLTYTQERVSTPVYPTPTPPIYQPTNAYATVTAYRLNVREIPNPYTGTILTKIAQGQTYAIIGRNDSTPTWWQLNVNGIIGWVNGNYTDEINTQFVPVTYSGGTTPPATGINMTTTANLNMRTGPSTGYPRLTVIPQFTSVAVLGRNAGGTWWLTQYGGITGWVSGSYVTFAAGADLNSVPVRW